MVANIYLFSDANLCRPARVIRYKAHTELISIANIVIVQMKEINSRFKNTPPFTSQREMNQYVSQNLHQSAGNLGKML